MCFEPWPEEEKEPAHPTLACGQGRSPRGEDPRDYIKAIACRLGYELNLFCGSNLALGYICISLYSSGFNASELLKRIVSLSMDVAYKYWGWTEYICMSTSLRLSVFHFLLYGVTVSNKDGYKIWRFQWWMKLGKQY